MESSTITGARYLELPYRLILTKEKRKGAKAWLALVDEFPGCEARGDTAEEATRALHDEMALWIADALENGKPVPRPRTDPSVTNGRLSLEIPHSLHQALMHTAVREGLTVDQLATIALAGAVRWRPEDEEADSRWIRARANRFLRSGAAEQPLAMQRALRLNAALLGLVALTAIVILIVAVAHGF